jgi:hypothetical protein
MLGFNLAANGRSQALAGERLRIHGEFARDCLMHAGV